MNQIQDTNAELKKRFPENQVINDDFGRGSVMVYIPRFNLSDVIDGASETPHPAFIVNGKLLSGIYISKFQNVLTDSLAYSLPDKDPATFVSFDEAIEYSAAKGEGWHLMTAAEWGAIALWCQKNGWLPYGNNDGGKDIREENISARIAYRDDEKAICRTETGSGPVSWSHNKREDGIYDLNANVWEWVGGMRLVFGEVQILENNDAASSENSQSADSEAWRAIDGTTGDLIAPDRFGKTPGSVKLDNIDGIWTYVSGELTSCENKVRFCDFGDVIADGSVCQKAKEILYSLGLLSSRPGYDYDGVSLYANNGLAERIPFRGGRYGQGKNTGVFKTCLDDPRSFSGNPVGFRSAYFVFEDK